MFAALLTLSVVKPLAVSENYRRWWQNLLEHLAFQMMQGNPVTEFRVAIPKAKVEEIFTEYLTHEKFDQPCALIRHTQLLLQRFPFDFLSTLQ